MRKRKKDTLEMLAREACNAPFHGPAYEALCKCGMLAAFARTILEAQAAAFEAEAATIDAGTMAGARSVLLQAARACRERAGSPPESSAT